MENRPATNGQSTPSPFVLKDSIRDLIRIEREYQLSDELFWEVFNARVLLDQPIDLSTYMQHIPKRSATA